jgi:hypothetical protein
MVFGRKTGVSREAEAGSQVLCYMHSITYLEVRKMGTIDLIKSRRSWHLKPINQSLGNVLQRGLFQVTTL